MDKDDKTALKKFAVVVAGGLGLRMGTQVPKQFLLLQGKPVLWHTLQTFLRSYPDMEIILVVPEEHMETGRTVIQATDDPYRIRMIHGGTTRFHSVRNGLQYIRERAVIFVHDGVRCLLSTDLVHSCYEEALRSGSAVPVIDCRDSVRLLVDGGSEAIDRTKVRLVQTPQTFLSDILLSAYQVEFQDRFTDEASVVEAAGGKVHLVEGEPTNIKITTPMDLSFAEQLLADR